MTTTQQFDLVLKNGHVVDPANNIDGRFDVGIKYGKIASVINNINLDMADDTIDVEGQIVMPGHIDTHAHVSSVFGNDTNRAYGHAMLVESGKTTTALDLAGNPTLMAEGMLQRGAGLKSRFFDGFGPSLNNI
ncbi:MAG: hypothetical protein Ct9H300mP19_14330 [Dehalococcoidia bacterium]|nr:MAG: hypothetical protein Ct9H300mP19_14330 [Dehalococcoidia bacterium]